VSRRLRSCFRLVETPVGKWPF